MSILISKLSLFICKLVNIKITDILKRKTCIQNLNSLALIPFCDVKKSIDNHFLLTSVGIWIIADERFRTPNTLGLDDNKLHIPEKNETIKRIYSRFICNGNNDTLYYIFVRGFAMFTIIRLDAD